jgi:L-threonylcarbamoyladenylate synthase
MRTERFIVNPKDLDSNSSQGAIERAARILRTGGTVAFPTETVYGLGANALNVSAVAKIFSAKQRPSWDPLIVHVSHRSEVASIVTEVTENAKRLMTAFWPGPLTVLLPRNTSVPDAITAGRSLVGVRVPSHPVAQALLRTAGVPIAAPSANSFGRISPTRADHVVEDLAGKIDAIVDSGETTHGLESTVVDPGVNRCIVYRPGVITLDQIREVCPDAVAFSQAESGADAPPESSPSPGTGFRHYAPRARLILIEADGSGQQRRMIAEAQAATQRGEKLGIMLPEGFQPEGIGNDVFVYRWGVWTNMEELAHNLFAGLRWLDAAGSSVIVCPLPEAKGLGVAIRDRLRKAAWK